MKHLGKLRISFECASDSSLAQPGDSGLTDGSRGVNPQGLPAQTALAKKATWAQKGNYSFLLFLAYYRKLYRAALDVEDGVGSIPL
jgi:hypothetical protein